MSIYRDVPNPGETPTSSATLAGFGALIPITYGRDRIKPLIATAAVSGQNLIQLCVWGLGPIEAVESITINDLAPPSGVTIRHYQGTVSQGVDAGLGNAIAGYADTLRGLVGGDDIEVAYSVIETPAGVVTGWPRVMGVIKGRKVFDPRSGSTAWSDNPVLCLADYISSDLYGQGRAVLGIEAAADACDELVNGERRRRIGLSLKDQKRTSEWVEELRGYAGCFAIPEGAAVRLVPNRPAASVGTIHADDMEPGTFKPKRPSSKNLYTVVTVSYTDTSEIPWRTTGRAIAYAAGVKNRTRPWKEKTVSRPGIQSGDQALRDAVELLNEGTESGLQVPFMLRDMGLKYQGGDVADVVHPLYSNPIRILKSQPAGQGNYKIDAVAYSDGLYDDSQVMTELLRPPPVPRSDNPDSPNITGAVSGNYTYQITADGVVNNRVKVTFNASSNPSVCSYNVRFRRAYTSDVWQPGTVEGLTAWLSPVIEGQTYEYEIQPVTCSGTIGSWSSGLHTVSKKDAAPPMVDSLTAETDQATGTRIVKLSYPSQPDDWDGFEIEYGMGGTYEPLIEGLTQRKIIETSIIPVGSAVVRARSWDRSKNVSGWRYTTTSYFPPIEPEGFADLRDDVQIIGGDLVNVENDMGNTKTDLGNTKTDLEGVSVSIEPIVLEFPSVKNTASNANSTATTAKSTAEAALARADGKSKVFRQAGTPTAEKPGDIWFHTGQQNKPYVWSGYAWDDADRLGPGVINTLHMASESISQSLMSFFVFGNVQWHANNQAPLYSPTQYIVASGGNLLGVSTAETGNGLNIRFWTEMKPPGGAWQTQNSVNNASGSYEFRTAFVLSSNDAGTVEYAPAEAAISVIELKA